MTVTPTLKFATRKANRQDSLALKIPSFQIHRKGHGGMGKDIYIVLLL